MIPTCPRNSFQNFGKGYIPKQNFGTFFRNNLVSKFKTIFYLNLKIYSNIYGIYFEMLCDDLCASGKVQEATKKYSEDVLALLILFEFKTVAKD